MKRKIAMDTSVVAVTDLPEGLTSLPGVGPIHLKNIFKNQVASILLHADIRDNHLHVLELERGWACLVPLAKNCHEQNVEITDSPRGLVLRTTRPVRARDQLLVWISPDLLSTLEYPFLNTFNIRENLTYHCHKCGAIYKDPNPLKVHLSFFCKGRKEIFSEFFPCNKLHFQDQMCIAGHVTTNNFAQKVSAQHRLPDIFSREREKLSDFQNGTNVTLPKYPYSCERSVDLPNNSDSLRWKLSRAQGDSSVTVTRDLHSCKGSVDSQINSELLCLKLLLLQRDTNVTVPKDPYSCQGSVDSPINSDSFYRKLSVLQSGTNVTIPTELQSKESVESPINSDSKCRKLSIVPDDTNITVPRNSYGCEGSVDSLINSNPLRWKPPLLQGDKNVAVPRDPQIKESVDSSISLVCWKTTSPGHVCPYCGKVYSRKYGLKIHVRTHTGHKPLQCKFCRRPFSDPSNLNKHVRLHSDSDAPYRCPECGKVLVRKRDLDRHMKSRHPGHVS